MSHRQFNGGTSKRKQQVACLSSPKAPYSSLPDRDSLALDLAESKPSRGKSADSTKNRHHKDNYLTHVVPVGFQCGSKGHLLVSFHQSLNVRY